MLVANNVQTIRWPAKSLDLSPIDQNMDRATRVIHQMCAAIPQQYIHRHILLMSIRYLAVDDVQRYEIKLNTT